MRVAIDAMGGDRAPEEIVRGAVKALKEAYCEKVFLVGIGEKVREILKESGAEEDERIVVVETPDVIGMEESAIKALREKPHSSISATVNLVEKGAADAAISAGNTGAFVAASIFILNTLEGVKRPGIAVPFPSENRAGVCTIIDAGANIEAKPMHLIQYGVIGSIYAEAVLGVNEPRVALINVGSESSKGPERLRSAYRFLKHRSPVNFTGNVEGNDLFGDVCEVAVCDGLVGNVVLKVAEGMGEGMLRWFKRSLEKHMGSNFSEVKRSVMSELSKIGSYTEYGGAPLLGVNGIVIICHGRSNADAIANAVKVAARQHSLAVNEKIRRKLATLALEWWRPSRWMDFIRWGREDEED
ncbi:MAG: phosphate acyltransferase PlsX [Planctomycetota bacterium]|nr:phosphate acyltransferase PlsX [Planctomycetota bacterium]